MKLTVNHLHKIVKQTVTEASATEAFRAELAKALGTAVETQGPLVEVAERANYQLEVLERTGRHPRCEVKPSVALQFARHASPEVRKLVARLLPERFLRQMATDRDETVRMAVGKRVGFPLLKEMTLRFPSDDGLRQVFKGRQLHEGSLVLSEGTEGAEEAVAEFTHTAAVGAKEPLGDSVKQSDLPELSEAYYETLAEKLVQDYDTRVIESNWRRAVVHRYASSMKATSGVELDEAKLLKAIDEILKEKDEASLNESSITTLRDTMNRLHRRAQEGGVYLPVVEETEHPATGLMESGLSPSEFISRVNEIYSIKESILPPAIRKFRLGEGRGAQVKAPMTGRVPVGTAPGTLDERVLDAYVRHWNETQALQGEPLRLRWNCAPHSVDAIGFQIELR